MSLDVSLMLPACDKCGRTREEVYSDNITHNLGNMADAADIYTVLWEPGEQEYVYARDIIPMLKVGLASLKDQPEKYKRYNSPNGWGKYKHFVPFVERYLDACKQYPDALIQVTK